jgi:hypothetical protein
MRHDAQAQCAPFLFAVVIFAVVVVSTAFFAPAFAMGQGTGQAPSNACGLLAPDDIAKAASVKVGVGVAGQPIPGVLARCTWSRAGDTKVIVTLTDAPHMETTIAVQTRGGTAVSGVGSKAVAARAAALTGGYVVSALDAKGGFGVSILGSEGTLERAVALAKVVAGRR